MKKKLSGLLLFAFCYLNISAQQIFDSLLVVSHNTYPQEKIYLHFDKSYYNPGETIWFKAYLTNNSLPTTISKTMYAELINSDGKIIQRKTMPIIRGAAASNFELADSTYKSKLFVRAYTSWMLNFDSTLFYIKPLTVINPKQIVQKPTPPVPVYTLTIFPEGGDMVENLSCRLAFKTNNQEGIPFPVSGEILDSKNKTITDFNSMHDGMGMFTLIPLPNEKYKAVWKDKDGIQHETPLPTSKKLGVGFMVNRSEKKLLYTISRPDSVDDNFKTFSVVAQINQQLVYNAIINLTKKNKITAPIPTDSLPDGIMQITIFNADQIPVAERLAFINNGAYYFITDLHLVDKNITRHGKNVFQVDIGNNYLTNMSIAVTDADLDAGDGSKQNIFTGLLLSNDLKGYVHNPAQYFINDEDSLQQQLDLVMMTNGWRRYKWENILANRWPKISHQPDNYLAIKGNVYGISKMRLKDQSLLVILKTGGGKGSNNVLSIPVDEDGKFFASGMFFFDSSKLSYQFNNDKDKTLTETASFNFNNGLENSPGTNKSLFSDLYFDNPPPSNILLNSIKQSALYRTQEDLRKVKTLDVVVVKAKTKSPEEKMNDEYTSGLFNTGDAQIFKIEGDPLAPSYRTVLDYLQGKVAGLIITLPPNGQGGTITRQGSKTDIFLNESPVDIQSLQNIQMTDVAMIKVFDPPFFGSIGGGAGGAIAVYTRRGGGSTDNLKGLNTVTLKGYSNIKQFYMPNYDKSPSEEADYRTTLFWNPFLLMDMNSKRITIPVYNNDNCKKIRVVIEGINEAGQLTREEKVFE